MWSVKLPISDSRISMANIRELLVSNISVPETNLVDIAMRYDFSKKQVSVCVKVDSIEAVELIENYCAINL